MAHGIDVGDEEYLIFNFECLSSGAKSAPFLLKIFQRKQFIRDNVLMIGTIINIFIMGFKLRKMEQKPIRAKKLVIENIIYYLFLKSAI